MIDYSWVKGIKFRATCICMDFVSLRNDLYETYKYPANRISLIQTHT